MPDRRKTTSSSEPTKGLARKGRSASVERPSGASANAATTDRGRRTRQRILRAATVLFSTRGFGATRVDDVLRASETGKSQFYHYFDSKADLGRAVLRYQRTRAMPADRAEFGYLDSWDRIAAWFDEILQAATRAIRDAPESIETLSFEMPTVSEPLRRELTRTANLRRRLLNRGLRRMQRHGSLRHDVDANRLSAFAAAAIEGGLRLARSEDSVEPLRHALGETLSHLHRYAIGDRAS